MYISKCQFLYIKDTPNITDYELNCLVRQITCHNSPFRWYSWERQVFSRLLADFVGFSKSRGHAFDSREALRTKTSLNCAFGTTRMTRSCAEIHKLYLKIVWKIVNTPFFDKWDVLWKKLKRGFKVHSLVQIHGKWE